MGTKRTAKRTTRLTGSGIPAGCIAAKLMDADGLPYSEAILIARAGLAEFGREFADLFHVKV